MRLINFNKILSRRHTRKARLLTLVPVLALCLVAVAGYVTNSFNTSSAKFADGIIPAEMFEIKGIPNGLSPAEEWGGYNATLDNPTIDASDFPVYEGYHFVNVTIDGVVATYLGVLESSSDGDVQYYYKTLISEGSLDLTSIVLQDDQKYTINYAENEHTVSYEVELTNGDLPSEITAESIFGKAEEETINYSYSFKATVPYGYTAEIIRKIGDSEVKLTNDTYPLGTQPKYKFDGSAVVVDTSEGRPNVATMSASFAFDDVHTDETIVVMLTKSPTPKFDATYVLRTNNAGNRGSSAAPNWVWEDWYDHDNTDGDRGKRNIQTSDGWNWQSATSVFYKDALEMEDGSFVWTFQTNSTDSYILNGFAINGTSIDIPYYPKEVQDNVNEPKATDDSYKTTTELADGAVVTIEYLNAFGNVQRVYRVSITGAKVDMTVTSLNLMQGRSGANEFIINKLVGVHGEDETFEAIQVYENGAWGDRATQSPIVNYDYNTGDTSKNGATMRFKLTPGYNNPSYKFQTVFGDTIGDQESYGTDVKPLPSDDSTLDSAFIYGPDSDGWYYFNLVRHSTSYKIALLEIVAEVMQYSVEYTAGEVEDSTMPTDSNTYDIIENNSILISEDVPTDPADEDAKVFEYWTLVNADGEVIDENIKIYPGQMINLDDYDGKMLPDSTIRLQAVWAEVPEEFVFTYSVWIQYIDELGEVHESEAPKDTIFLTNGYDENTKIVVGINLDAPVFVDWLLDHPYYNFDESNSDIHEVSNGDKVIITFSLANGALDLQKKVLGTETGDGNYIFTIAGPEEVNGTFLAWPADIAIEDRTVGDEIILDFENGVASVELKAGEHIVAYLPGGDYIVTENPIEDADYRVNIDGVYVEEEEEASTDRMVVVGEDSEPIIYTNIFSDAVVGQIKVTNKITGSEAEADRVFSFNATIGEEEFEFALGDGESWTSLPFDAGTSYSVEEVDANEYGYKTTSSDNTEGGIPEDDIEEISFKNVKGHEGPIDAPKTLDNSTIWMIALPIFAVFAIGAVSILVSEKKKQ